MAWRIEITNTAKKQLAKLDHQVKAEIVRYLRERISTEDDPRLKHRLKVVRFVNNVPPGVSRILWTWKGMIMQTELLDEIKKMSVSERIRLVEEIWDGIVDAAGDGLTLSETQCAELDRRIDVYREQSEAGRSWHEIQEEYRRGGR